MRGILTAKPPQGDITNMMSPIAADVNPPANCPCCESRLVGFHCLHDQEHIPSYVPESDRRRPRRLRLGILRGISGILLDCFSCILHVHISHGLMHRVIGIWGVPLTDNTPVSNVVPVA